MKGFVPLAFFISGCASTAIGGSARSDCEDYTILIETYAPLCYRTVFHEDCENVHFFSYDWTACRDALSSLTCTQGTKLPSECNFDVVKF